MVATNHVSNMGGQVVFVPQATLVTLKTYLQMTIYYEIF